MTVSEDIADKFASKYKELYTSVTYDVDEMQGIDKPYVVYFWYYV